MSLSLVYLSDRSQELHWTFLSCSSRSDPDPVFLFYIHEIESCSFRLSRNLQLTFIFYVSTFGLSVVFAFFTSKSHFMFSLNCNCDLPLVHVEKHLLCFCQSLVDLTGLKSLSWKHFFDGNMQLLVFSCKKKILFPVGSFAFFISNIFGLNGGKVCEVEGRRNMSVWCWRPAAAAHWAAVGVLRLICLPRVPCFLWCLG